MTAEMLLVLAGVFVGFFLGRWWSEVSRGRFDARRAWRGRNAYRRRDDD